MRQIVHIEPRLSIKRLIGQSFVLLSLSFAHVALAIAPRLYSQPAYQSPVSGDPDGVVVIMGDGLDPNNQVVYQALPLTGSPIDHPDVVPLQSTAEVGTASIINGLPPFQITVRLPQVIVDRGTYALWVRNGQGEWSNAVFINDPRPLWFSPAHVYSTQSSAGLPRYLKVIGRNLWPPDPIKLKVKLEGRQSYELAFEPQGNPDRSLRRHVALMRLPTTLVPGTYRVSVQSGNSTRAEVFGQRLTVLRDTPISASIPVGAARFGGCRPSDQRDDTACIAKAIEEAQRIGGATLVFEPGIWDVSPDEIVLPRRVNLRGSTSGRATVLRHDRTSATLHFSQFILLGDNQINDLTFADAAVFLGDPGSHPILQLGPRYSTDEGKTTHDTIANVVITGNSFERTNGAIISGGAPIDGLFITYNRFGDYSMALELGGDRYNVRSPFHIDDSVIAFNRFMPGSYSDWPSGEGVMASGIGASLRMDFSSNESDGAERAYLNRPQDAPGWRAAHFWHMNNSHEMLLISENAVSCSGDKAGDGEAISFDNNANTFAFRQAQLVTSATPDTLQVMGAMASRQNDRTVDVASYYLGHWLRIDSGRGIGQARKIVSYRISGDGSVTFVVSPSWDVLPESGASRVTVTREFWQAFILANTIDQRKPPCAKSNTNRPKGGSISLWSQITDSVVAGNSQYDTEGIIFIQSYLAAESRCTTCTASTIIPSFLDIRSNRIDGEYDWDSTCSSSGIVGFYGASPTPLSPPPLLSVALTISQNSISHADGLTGGAIDILPSGYQGPPGYAKPLVAGIVIDHNDITHVSGRPPSPACNYQQKSRIGINLTGGARLDWNLLYKNRCFDVSKPLNDRASHTQRVCDANAQGSCECP